MTFVLSPNAAALFREFEGLDQPGEWPGGESGTTLGLGYDLGYEGEADFVRDWSPHLPPAAVARLRAACGVRGPEAAELAESFADITVDREAALEVFFGASVGKYWTQLQHVFPGVELLPADAQGALLSLVYNRGTSLSGSNRREMLAIQSLVAQCAKAIAASQGAAAAAALGRIAQQIRAMKRLWRGKGLDGLLRRRDAEADLVASAAAAL